MILTLPLLCLACASLAASVQRYSKESHTLVCFKVQRLNSTHSHALPYIHPFSILVMIVNVVED